MAYQYASDSTESERGNNNNNNQQQRPNLEQHRIPQHHPGIFRRSRPISIPGHRENNSEEDDEDMQSTSSSNGAPHSVPSRLLLAPRLGSKPTDYDQYLPALFLSDAAERRPPMTSYGSLRESQSLNFAGPWSYANDRRVEHLRHNQHSRKAGLSVAERIQSRKLQQQQQQDANVPQKSTGMSSLTAMMNNVGGGGEELDESMEEDKKPSATPDTMSTVTDRYEDSIPFAPPVLSTSMTGLEVLRQGLQQQRDQQQRSLSPAVESPGGSSLSRSLSEPVPFPSSNGSSAMNTTRSSPALSVLRNPNNNAAFFLPPARSVETTTNANCGTMVFASNRAPSSQLHEALSALQNQREDELMTDRLQWEMEG